MKIQFVEPKYEERVFTCPNCQATAKQKWSTVQKFDTGDGATIKGWFETPGARNVTPQWELDISICDVCDKFILWYEGERVYPSLSSVEEPAEDMPVEVKQLYNEARAIVQLSPKSACALLRLSLEKILVHLGYPKSNKLVVNINKLKEDGKVDEYIYAAMDSVRLLGNNAVHPGKIDIDDNPEYAFKLFKLLNYIVDELISRPIRAKAFRESFSSK